MESKTGILKQIIKLKLPAANAVANQGINTALAQHGVNINSFLILFNKISINFPKFLMLNVLVFVYDNKTFDIKIKGPILSLLILDYKKKFLKTEFFKKDLIFLLFFYYKNSSDPSFFDILNSNKFIFFKKMNILIGVLKSMNIKYSLA